MNVAVLVDYANLFYRIKETGVKPRDIATRAAAVLGKLVRYVETHDSRCLHNAHVTTRLVAVLRTREFNRTATALSKVGFKIVEAAAGKTEQERASNLSAEDDIKLKHTIQDLPPATEAVVLVSLDGDFISLAQQVRYEGLYFLLAAYETPSQRLPWKWKQQADEILPLHDIDNDAEEGEPLPIVVEDGQSAERARAGEDSACVEFYHSGQRLFIFWIERREIEIGRRSQKYSHFPHIDLTDYDIQKVTSRRHLRVFKDNANVFNAEVHPECSRGTWHNGCLLERGESAVLRDGDGLVLGGENGFAAVFRRFPVIADSCPQG